ncbi:MAG: tyrosine-protein phosphatase [Desulfobacterales bacterium]
MIGSGIQMTEEALDPRRHIDLVGAQNVRDLGGYATADGRITRWRRFVRSDGMHLLTKEDQEKLVAYGIGTVIDLRMTVEVEKLPNVFTDSKDVQFHHLNLMADLKKGEFQKAPESTEPADRFAHMYRQFLSGCQNSIAEIMRTLADARDHACIYHCAGGKDRTGVISALLLGVAGVPEKTIAEDYALTALHPSKTKKPKLDSPDADYEIDPLYAWKMISPPEAMSLTLEFLNGEYDGIEGYLRTIGLVDEEITTLRSKMLDG